MSDDRMQAYREFLKDNLRQEVDFSQSDQSQGLPPPPVEKPFAPDAMRLPLPGPGEWQGIGAIDLKAAIANRESRRRYRPEPLTLDEVSFLLWACQGIRQVMRPGMARRTVPSAGSRHALETYLIALNVEELEPAVYRYLPVENQLLFEFAEEDLPDKITEATLGQRFIGTASAVVVWTAIPYRMEWRYSYASHKVIAMDAGHACQNLYLAVEAIGYGTCGVAAYDQEGMDRLLRVDGVDEFTIYMAPVGKV